MRSGVKAVAVANKMNGLNWHDPNCQHQCVIK